MSDLTIVTNQTGPASIVTVSGRVDSETAPQLEAALSAITSQGASKIIVNLSELEYMSSAGLRSLVGAAKSAKNGGGELKLAAIPQMIQSVMYTVGLDKMVNVYANVEEASASF